MTAAAEPLPADPTVELGKLWDLPAAEVEDMACRAHLGVWTARKLDLDMADVHWAWSELAMSKQRLALVAPREFGKSVALSINATAWRSIYQPGTDTYMFALTSDLAEELVARTRTALEQVRPDLVEAASKDKATDLVLANGSRIRCAGAGKRTRGAHPDVIIGDDVLDDQNCATSLQRRKIHNWWFGSVVPMAHPGTVRQIRQPDGTLLARRMPPTRIHLVGTPFHEQDLLLGMKSNAMWAYYRYQAEFRPDELVPGTLAVEVT